MDFHDISDEIIEERRLVDTWLTRKPYPSSVLVSFGFILVMGITSYIYWNVPNIAPAMPAVGVKVFEQGEWWRLFTAIFIHGDFGHFLSNMYMLGIFSFFVYGYFGTWAYPFSAFLGAALVNALSVATYPSEVRLLGASGLVYLLGGFWLSLYFMIQRQYSVGHRLLRITGMALMVFFPSTFVPTTSYRTHAIGIAVGAVMGLGYFVLNKKRLRGAERYKLSLVASNDGEVLNP